MLLLLFLSLYYFANPSPRFAHSSTTAQSPFFSFETDKTPTSPFHCCAEIETDSLRCSSFSLGLGLGARLIPSCPPPPPSSFTFSSTYKTRRPSSVPAVCYGGEGEEPVVGRYESTGKIGRNDPNEERKFALEVGKINDFLKNIYI